MEKGFGRISEAEWEIMRVIWANKESTSKEITAILAVKKEWKTTTVKTLLHRLTEKQCVGTRQAGNKFIYFPLIEQEQSFQFIAEELKDKLCNRKIGSLLAVLIQENQLSKEDIHLLMDMLQEKSLTAPVEGPCDCTPGQCQCHLIDSKEEE